MNDKIFAWKNERGFVHAMQSGKLLCGEKMKGMNKTDLHSTITCIECMNAIRTIENGGKLPAPLTRKHFEPIIKQAKEVLAYAKTLKGTTKEVSKALMQWSYEKRLHSNPEFLYLANGGVNGKGTGWLLYATPTLKQVEMQKLFRDATAYGKSEHIPGLSYYVEIINGKVKIDLQLRKKIETGFERIDLLTIKHNNAL